MHESNRDEKHMAGDVPGEPRRWSVAILSSRESPGTLARTLAASVEAAASSSVIVDVVINGNPDLARSFADAVPPMPSNAAVRVWSVLFADKAHAWNVYAHRIRPESSVAFFVDGYARPRPGAFASLAAALDRDTHALAATGVPSIGRSAAAMARQMHEEGGIHGNMHAVRGTALAELVRRGFRLPQRLYRVDGLLGAALCFSLDPPGNGWDPKRIVVVPEASWEFDPLSPWRPRDLAVYLRRYLRQSRGMIENAAMRQFFAVERHPIGALPASAIEFCSAWLREHRDSADDLFRRHWLCRRAARELLAADPAAADETDPELVWQSDAVKSAG